MISKQLQTSGDEVSDRPVARILHFSDEMEGFQYVKVAPCQKPPCEGCENGWGSQRDHECQNYGYVGEPVVEVWSFDTGELMPMELSPMN